MGLSRSCGLLIGKKIGVVKCYMQIPTAVTVSLVSQSQIDGWAVKRSGEDKRMDDEHLDEGSAPLSRKA